ncbi:uncharacterized protein LOC107465848 [Arachis duranensis]|uniref:Uncharacterized protein LOC107465848 n=1 Tax=Arachis duranensis TaxID=130453 RepID=A0A6P4BI76_ARADU|nr:uncharacterized protein LOC107465848 [Arachis duranensis]
MTLERALCDLGVSINLMPLSMMKKLTIEEVKPTKMSLQMADRSLKIPNRVVENLLVKVGEFTFRADFVILDMEEEGHNSIILGRPFLATAKAIIDVEKGEMVLRVHNEQIIINVFKAMQYTPEKEKHIRVKMIEDLVEEVLGTNGQEEQEEEIEANQDVITFEGKTEEVPKQELKPLPPHLKWEGPYRVEKAEPYGVFHLSHPSSSELIKVNGHRLKLYHGEMATKNKELEIFLLEDPLATEN